MGNALQCFSSKVVIRWKWYLMFVVCTSHQQYCLYDVQNKMAYFYCSRKYNWCLFIQCMCKSMCDAWLLFESSNNIIPYHHACLIRHIAFLMNSNPVMLHRSQASAINDAFSISEKSGFLRPRAFGK